MRRTAASGPPSTISPPSAALHSLSLGPLDSPRRTGPRSAGSASLPTAPPTLTRTTSWESDNEAKRENDGSREVSPGLTKFEAEEEGSPFDDPLRSPSTGTTDHRASIISTTTNEIPSDFNYARRNSVISTSSMSQSPTSPMGMYVASTSRQRYSIASSCYAHTIGDLSTSSMPLLRHPTRGTGGDDTSSNPGTDSQSNRYPASSSSRVHLAEFTSSRGSCYSDDASSVHSYPPKPRQRTGSTWTSDSGWMREFESTGATGQVHRRGSADSRSGDSWPPVVANSYVHQPLARPVPAYLSQLSSYSFPSTSQSPSKAPPTRLTSSGAISRSGTVGTVNPLAPLRKRLARSLAGSGAHLHTEVQLLLELVDALDHCITLFSSPSPSEQAFSPVSRSTPPTTTSLPTEDSNGTPSISPARSTQSKTALLDELRLLVRELVELVPDAQRCLTNGQYGPLAFPNTTTSRLMDSLEKKSTESLSDRTPLTHSSAQRRRSSRLSAWDSSPLMDDWWPSRLARDCRNLLVEAGLPTGKGSTVWLAARLSQTGGVVHDYEGLEAQAGKMDGVSSTAPEIQVSRTHGAMDHLPATNGGMSMPVRSEGRQEDKEKGLDGVELGQASIAKPANIFDADLGTTTPPPKIDSESSRRDELLEQGKKRWEAYRKQQMQKEEE
ncbi:uncharacterized protein JCM6883_007058 [Sporobolomyces salmoneus]|uniref:uncharacterized protein n=1 Tax=Sporobolomyces salmoneus TaxID=183962 RepID=UPI00317A89EF